MITLRAGLPWLCREGAAARRPVIAPHLGPTASHAPASRLANRRLAIGGDITFHVFGLSQPPRRGFRNLPRIAPGILPRYTHGSVHPDARVRRWPPRCPTART